MSQRTDVHGRQVLDRPDAFAARPAPTRVGGPSGYVAVGDMVWLHSPDGRRGQRCIGLTRPTMGMAMTPSSRPVGGGVGYAGPIIGGSEAPPAGGGRAIIHRPGVVVTRRRGVGGSVAARGNLDVGGAGVGDVVLVEPRGTIVSPPWIRRRRYFPQMTQHCSKCSPKLSSPRHSSRIRRQPVDMGVRRRPSRRRDASPEVSSAASVCSGCASRTAVVPVAFARLCAGARFRAHDRQKPLSTPSNTSAHVGTADAPERNAGDRVDQRTVSGLHPLNSSMMPMPDPSSSP